MSDQNSESSPLAVWLIEARKAKGWSSNQLGDRSGISAAAINKIEAGLTRNVRKATRSKLESALAVKIPGETADEIAMEADVPGLGKLEDFDPHSPDERPKGPGVYVLYDISERPIYVGEAQNVGARIQQHVEKFWFKSPIVESASWIKIADSKLRRQIEQLMIRFLKRNAVINKQHVERASGRGAKGNLHQPKEYRPTVEVVASILKGGPRRIPALFECVLAEGARCKSKQSLNAMLRLKENHTRFEYIGDETWRLRGRG